MGTTTAETTTPYLAQSDNSYPSRVLGQDFSGTSNYPGSLLTPTGTTLYQGHAYVITSTGTIVNILPSSTNDQHLLAVGLWDGLIMPTWGATSLVGDSSTTYTCLELKCVWRKNDGLTPVTAAYIGQKVYFVNGDVVSLATDASVSGYAPLAGVVEEIDGVLNLVKINMNSRY